MTGFDTHHTNKDRIYRFVTASNTKGQLSYSPGIPIPLVEAVKAEFPEFEKVSFTRYFRNGMITVNLGKDNQQQFQEYTGLVYTDDLFYQIFDRKWLAGNKVKSLLAPNSVVLSEKLAIKYFGSIDVLGNSLNLNSDKDLLITGVMEDYPEGKTDFPFEMLISFNTISKDINLNNWGSIASDDQCYALLNDGEDISSVEVRIRDLENKYYGEENSDDYIRHYHEIQSLKDLHFDDRYTNYNYKSVSRESIYGLVMLGIFLLITACVNFINLATAQAVRRSKEVGIRKVLGSGRKQLIFQFLGETMLITLMATVLSFAITELSLIKLNDFLELNLHLNLSSNLMIWVYVISLVLGVTLLAGFYPALILSGYKPIEAINNTLANSQTGGMLLRRSLVTFQFIISQVLIIGIVVITSQMDFLRNSPMGFQKEGIINIYLPSSQKSKREVFRNKILQVPGVESISFVKDPPASNSSSTTNFGYYDEDGRKEDATLVKVVDENYISTFGLKLLAGTSLPASDTLHSFIINEESLRLMGISDPENALGKLINLWGIDAPIVGVVKNFNTASFRKKVKATILYSDAQQYYTAGVKINLVNIPDTQSRFETIFKEVYPGYNYDYEFMDQIIESFYVREARMAQMLNVFAGIAVFIGCLGLFGLVSFMSNRKIKEIGIRKVLGASSGNIIFIFFGEFSKLLLFAFIIAAPIAYFGMESWLQDFSYRINQSAGMFALAIAITLAIAFLTVGFRSFKASIANPVNSLRNE